MMTKPTASAFPVSDNVAEMKASSTLAAMQAAEAMRAAGVDVVDLGAGEPDFDTPQNIKDAAESAMRAGKTKYTPTAGVRELQQAIIGFYQREFGAAYERNEVMATAGGKQAVFNAVVSLINPGDEVLIPKPYWVTFPEIVTFARGKSVFIETEENDFVPDGRHDSKGHYAPDQADHSELAQQSFGPRNPAGRVQTDYGNRSRARSLRDL